MATVEATDIVLDQRLHAVLTAHGVSPCKRCGRVLDRGDMTWNNADNENGTPYSIFKIDCQQCGTEALYMNVWGGVDSFSDVLEKLENAQDWRWSRRDS